MFARSIRWVAFVLLLFPALVRAQGLLVVVDPAQQVRLPRPIIIWPPPYPRPRPIPRPMPTEPLVTYKIDSLEVDARVTDQVAKVQVSQSFVNTGSRLMEVAFIFPLPYDGAIDRMTLLIDGREMPAKLLGADDARRQYEEIVRKNRDPALLEWIGTGLFKTSVFPVPPGAKRTVTLRYTAALPQAGRDDRFPLPLEHGEIHVAPGREDRLPRLGRERGRDQEHLQPHARHRDQAGRRPSCDRHATRPRTRFPRPISACSTTSATAR